MSKKTAEQKAAGRALLAALGLGLFVGIGAAFGLARETPAALGLFTFCGVIIGAGIVLRGR